VATAVNSDLGTILLNVQNQLITKGVFGSTAQLGLSLLREPSQHVSARFYGSLIPGTQFYDRPAVVGGGHYTSEVRGLFSLYVYAQNAVDQFNQDNYALTNSTTGLLTLVLNAANALQLYLPLDNDGNPLTMEPIRLVSQTEPLVYPHSPEWSYVSLLFEARFALNIDSANP
jgi:hypothetical protein